MTDYPDFEQVRDKARALKDAPPWQKINLAAELGDDILDYFEGLEARVRAVEDRHHDSD